MHRKCMIKPLRKGFGEFGSFICGQWRELIRVPAMGGPVRLRVVFEDPFLLRGSQRRKGLHQCWLQLRPDLATIADLAAYLHQTFGLRSSCPRGLLLYMDNFILPSFESTCILKDEDIIMVKKNGVVFKDVLKVSGRQNQLQVLQSRQTSALNNSNLASKEPQGNSQADEYDLVLCGGNTAHMETLPSEKGNAQNKRKHSHKLQGSDDTLAAKDSEGDSQGDEDNVGLHGNITCNETSTRKMISKRKRKFTKKLKSSDTLVFKDSQGESQDEVDVDLANGNAAHKETPSEMTNAKNKRKKSSKFKFLCDSLAIKDSQGDSHRDEEDVDLHGNAMQKEAPSQIMKANHERKYSKKLEASNTAIMNSQGDLQEAEEDSGFPIGNIVRREAPSCKMTNSKHKRKLSNKFQSSDTLAIKDSQGNEEDLDLPNVNVAHPETASSEKRNVKHNRKHSDNLQASEKQSKGNAIAPASENADGDARKLPSRSARRKKAKRIWHRTYGSEKKLKEVQKLENESQRETSVHANADQDTVVDNELLPVIVRPGHIRFESSDMCSMQTNGPTLTEIEVPKNQIQKESSENENADENTRAFIVRPGHIRYESSDTRRMEADGPVEYLKWNGTTSKKKGQKWGREKIFYKWNDSNSSIQLCNEESNDKAANLVKVLSGKSSVKEVEVLKESTAKQAEPVMEFNENSVAKESDAVKQLIEFESLLPVTCLPVEGDVLVYRLVELSSLWCPEVSPFRVGKVSSYDSSSKKIILFPLPEYPLLLKEMSEEGPESGSLYNEDGSLEIDFSSLVDVRWFKPPESEGTTHILPMENLQNAAPVDDQELASCSSDRIVNGSIHTVNELNKGWEEINQVLKDKKAQLQKENDLDKRNSNTSASTSPWPYKALRRNALGPTLALLRSSNVDEGK